MSQQQYRQWVFYDGECRMCVNFINRMRPSLSKRGFGLTALQTDWVKEITKQINDPLNEMLVLTSDRQLIGGADAFVYLARRIWWAWFIYGLALLPGVKYLYRRIYRFVAKNRYCLNGSCEVQ